MLAQKCTANFIEGGIKSIQMLRGSLPMSEDETTGAVVKHEGDNIQHRVSTGEIAPVQTVSSKVVDMLGQAGTVEFSEDQQKILFDPIEEEIVEIRPDGLIYLPWMEYVTKLRKAFGGKWAIIPATDKPGTSPDGNSLMWGFYLFIDGKPYGYAIGEQEYKANNPVMGWSDACEGAKSNALMRLCKGLGIGLELWKPSFIRAWKEKYAESYWDKNAWDAKRNKKGKYLWRKKGESQPEGHFSNDKEEIGKGRADTREAPFTPYIPEEESDGKHEDSPLPGVDPKDIAAKGEKKKVDQDIEDIVTLIRAAVEKINKLDYREFKAYLAEVQDTMKKKFVGKQYGNLSLKEGKRDDLWYLAQNTQSAIDSFVKWKAGKEKKDGKNNKS